MENCVFCRIIKGELPSHRIFEDDDFLAFLDINPINPGHIVIVPKTHIGYIFDLPENLYQGIFQVARRLAEPLQKATQAKKIGMAVEGFGVDHVHLHLVPVNKGNELDPNRAKSAQQGELEVMAEKIRTETK